MSGRPSLGGARAAPFLYARRVPPGSGSTSTHTLGKLEIQELAREYMARKNATLEQFHDAFVTQGPLPIPLIRKILLR